MKLCSDEFFDFFMKIPDNACSIEELSGYIAKSVPPVCDMLNIGKLELCLNMPKSPYEERIKDNLTMLYCFEDGYDNKPVSNTYTTSAGSSAVVLSYPRNGTAWSSSDIECLALLSSVINTLCGKAGLTKLARISAVTDSVTGSANVAGVDAFIENCCERKILSQYTAVYINIKNFRYFNHQFGASYGDEILKKYAHSLESFLRKDEICGRLNNDTYLAIVKNGRVEKFLDYLADIRLRLNINEITNTFNIQSKVCIYPIADGDNPETIIRNISIAINSARNRPKRDLIRFDISMLDDMLHDKEISNNFSKAIALKEFDVYYQPKINLKNGALCGCEALVRWNRNSNLLSPSDFIHVLEKDGTICALDLYVLEEVCIRLRAWLDAGITPVRVSINFSKVHLHNRFLAEDIMGILNKYSIPPQYIEIELNESSGYDDFTSLSDFIRRIKGYGVYASIDNFGTGYSSLKLMSDLDINVIKLDRSFVTGITESADSSASLSYTGEAALRHTKNTEVVIKSIIEIAHALDISVTCAGIENDSQEALLKQIGCDMGQGFLYDRPLPCDVFEKKLQGAV